jgi:hypothetical protein
MNPKIALLLYVCLSAAVFWPRLAALDTFTSPDEAQWERNTQHFVTALRQGDFKHFYQQPHPGITTQWLGAPAIYAATWGEKRFPLALFLSLCVLGLTYLVRRLWGDGPALTAGFLLALNPMLIAHTRVLAMDALLAVFMLAAVLFHLLWLRDKRPADSIGIGVCTALALLSKMSAVGLIMYLGAATALAWRQSSVDRRQIAQGLRFALIAACAVFIGLFPTVVTNAADVWAGTVQFFTTEHFQQEVHALGPWWYPQAFLLWTTPVQILGLALLAAVLARRGPYRTELGLMTLFCLLFFFEIQLAVKKGDRYMLPDFVVFDVLTAGALWAAWQAVYATGRRGAAMGLAMLAAAGIMWQGYDTLRLHPYLLAYRNPFFRAVANDRTMGWGEGLDLAAAYLNQKPDSEHMLVAAYYEGPFSYHFKGQVTSAERLAKENAKDIGASYVVLYRTMQGRAPDRWETTVLREYAGRVPEKIIYLNGEAYAWIYRVND